MIDIIKQTPSEYSSQSRDYQILARLYTAIFNISKMYIDNLQIWDNNIDNKLTTLRAKTLNFDAKRSWDLDDLEAVTSCFKYLMLNKGTAVALEYCVNILMKIENIIGEDIDEIVSIDNTYNVTIRVPENLFTLGILEDLVEYLLPAGLTYNIVRYKTANLSGGLVTDTFVYNKNLNYVSSEFDDKMLIGDSDDERYITDTFVYTDKFNNEENYHG